VVESTYSPRLRTAVVLCGAGTGGAYQAGVLRALSEAGVKVDLIAAHGAGVVTALCAAIDGGARLWDPAGPWASPHLVRAYRWRPALRVAGAGLVVAGLVLVAPVAVLGLAAAIYALSLLASLLSLTTVAAWLVDLYARAIGMLFHPPIVPTLVPRALVLTVLAVVIVIVSAAIGAARHDPARRRLRGAFWWRLVGAPLTAEEPAGVLLEVLWRLVRGGSSEPRPVAADLGRRYVETLTENLGQPGFRELLLAVHDIDSRRDLVGGLLSREAQTAFQAGRSGLSPRAAEVVEWTGPQRALLVDFLTASLRLPFASPAHVAEFPADSYWRGERHRLCDRPGLPVRLVEEAAGAGVEQIILVSATPPPAVAHSLRSRPLDLRGRMGEVLQGMESAAVHDAYTAATARFSGVFVVRPDHNAIGPFDFGGAHDEASDRKTAVRDLIDQGYGDAYRQFIEPIVAAGDRIEAV
jgi:hypothetical protein